MNTKRFNGPVLGLMSFLLSVVLVMFIFGYFMVMARLVHGGFNIFETVSICIMLIPLSFGIGSVRRKEKMLSFAVLGIVIAVATIGILALMFTLNGM